MSLELAPGRATDFTSYLAKQAEAVKSSMNDPTVSRVILQNGCATGDVFQVASALKLHQDLGVVLFSSGPDAGREKGE